MMVKKDMVQLCEQIHRNLILNPAQVLAVTCTPCKHPRAYFFLAQLGIVYCKINHTGTSSTKPLIADVH